MTVEIYTIGHSNHAFEHFADLLARHRIDVVADVRSAPYSKYSPHFDRRALEHSLPRVKVAYEFFGDTLGGRPEDDEYYNERGQVVYGRVARAAYFRDGLSRVAALAAKKRVALMCSEEDPAICHRHLLVTRVLESEGACARHIRGDGRLDSTRDIDRDQSQLALFAPSAKEKDETWTSIRSVSRGEPPRTSS